MSAADDLRAEYVLIQNLYEDFDKRALSLKGLAAPLLGAGLIAGAKEANHLIVAITCAVALSLWALEAIWKSFQYCLRGRIERLEEWYRQPAPADMPPFQIYTQWTKAWRQDHGNVRAFARVLFQPFVFLPYAVIIAAGAALVA